jgi:hypothetical protein
VGKFHSRQFPGESETYRQARDELLLYAPTEPGQNPRHVDSLWPLWNVFDLTPEGRGTDWYPKHSYD